MVYIMYPREHKKIFAVSNPEKLAHISRNVWKKQVSVMQQLLLTFLLSENTVKRGKSSLNKALSVDNKYAKNPTILLFSPFTPLFKHFYPLYTVSKPFLYIFLPHVQPFSPLPFPCRPLITPFYHAPPPFLPLSTRVDLTHPFRESLPQKFRPRIFLSWHFDLLFSSCL